MKPTVTRLFFDPGTNSCGWAVFRNDLLVDHGTFDLSGAELPERLFRLGKAVKNVCLSYQPDEVYFERMNRVVNVAVVWAVGLIVFGSYVGTGGRARIGTPYTDQISPSSWKKYDREKSAYNTYRPLCQSDDEVVAILMGLYKLEQINERR
jgi:hypothetical protein